MSGAHLATSLRGRKPGKPGKPHLSMPPHHPAPDDSNECGCCIGLQEALETCNSLQQQSEEWHDELAAKHSVCRKELTALRDKARKLAAKAASEAAE